MAVISKLTFSVVTSPLKGTFQPIFYKAFRNRQDCVGALQMLRQAIASGGFKPFFQRGEIDRLFREDVLKKYGVGRYYDSPPSLLDHWRDLINNIASPILTNLYFLSSGDVESLAERKLVSGDIQDNFRKLKIIEDWIAYHFDEVKDVIPPQVLPPKS
jgi:hypothetical protein